MNVNIEKKINDSKKVNQEIIKSDQNKKNSSIKKNIKCTIRLETKLLHEIKKITSHCNKKQYGKTIVAQDVIDYGLKLIKEDHIKKIIEASYSIQDKIMIDCSAHNEKNSVSLSYDEYLAMKLKIQ